MAWRWLVLGGLRSVATALVLVGVCSCGVANIQDDLRRLQSSMNDLRSFQAEQTTKISSLENQVRQISGRVEELEYSQKIKLGADLSTLKNDLSDLKRRVPPPAIVPALLLDSDEESVERMPPEIAPLFREAFQELREGKFGDAEDRLREALNLSRGTQWAADVLFWMGVCRDGVSNNREALQAYHSVVADYPKHKKAAPALLRQSAVFERLGDVQTAKTTLKKLVTDYPKTEDAARARERLRSLP